MTRETGGAVNSAAIANPASVSIRIDKIVVDPALVPRAQAAAYRARLTARLRAMAADPALATASAHELEARIARHAREAIKGVKPDA